MILRKGCSGLGFHNAACMFCAESWDYKRVARRPLLESSHQPKIKLEASMCSSKGTVAWPSELLVK
jgi:hypothetical protein